MRSKKRAKSQKHARFNMVSKKGKIAIEGRWEALDAGRLSDATFEPIASYGLPRCLRTKAFSPKPLNFPICLTNVSLAVAFIEPVERQYSARSVQYN